MPPRLWGRGNMLGGMCRIIAALVIATIPFVAVAQVIPPSEQPGRARQQFIEPQAPLARPGGAAISLPSTVAPPGADKINLVVRGVRIIGSTVYSAEEL